MTGLEIKTQFEGLVDANDVGDTLVYQLMNMIKDQVDEDRPWEYRKAKDTSQTASSSDTHETAKTLPADFASPLDVIYVGEDEYLQVPFQTLKTTKDSSRRFAVDISGSNFYLTGRVSGTKTIDFWYLKTTTDIAAGTEPEWPTRWHKLIAPLMAEMYPAIENMERGRSWDDKWQSVSARFLSAMRKWDNRLKRQAAKYAPSYDASADAYRIND